MHEKATASRAQYQLKADKGNIVSNSGTIQAVVGHREGAAEGSELCLTNRGSHGSRHTAQLANSGLLYRATIT